MQVVDRLLLSHVKGVQAKAGRVSKEKGDLQRSCLVEKGKEMI